MPETGWIAFPGTTSPKLWIGPDDSVRNALSLYQPASARGLMLKRLFQALPDAWARAILPKAEQTKAVELHTLASELRKMTGKHAAAISIYSGTPGPHRKRTAQITEYGRITLYAKIGESTAARELIRREHRNLLLLQNAPRRPFRMPEPAGLIEEQDRTIVIQTAPGQAVASAGRRALGDSDMDALHWLHLLQPGHLALHDVLGELGITALIDDPDLQQTPHASTLRNAVDFLTRAFDGNAVTVAFAHGDYAAWNTHASQGSEIYLFDWEYGGPRMPALFDLVHFLFMPARLVERLAPSTAVNRVVNQLESISGHPLVAGIGGRNLLTAHILLYLLALLARDFQANSPSSSYVMSCIHYLLLMSGHGHEALRILVAAYACNPDEGSEPGVGWNMVTAIATRHETWVVTRNNNRTAIEAALSREPQPRLHFVYVDLPRWASFWKKGGRGIRTYYYLWQLMAWKKTRRLRRKICFDLAHHVTFVNDWLFSFIPLLGLPSVWGPIGSHPCIPFPLRMDLASFVGDRIRYGFQAFMRFVDPLFWSCLARSRVIVGIENGVIRRMPPIPGIHPRFISHTAIGVEELPPPRARLARSRPGLRVLSAGRLVTIKGFHITLMAFAELVRSHPDATLRIVGKGPLKERLVRLAEELSITDSVEFVDWLPRKEVIEAMRQSDVFLFPSFEGGGMVVLEAMANQLPVVCLDYGGPGQMVGEKCGFRAEPAPLPITVQKLGEALCRYADKPDLLAHHGSNARHHVETHYLWTRRMIAIEQWYREAVQGKTAPSGSRSG